jgi:hypothetical protein
VNAIYDTPDLELFVIDELQDRLAVHRGPGNVE